MIKYYIFIEITIIIIFVFNSVIREWLKLHTSDLTPTLCFKHGYFGFKSHTHIKKWFRDDTDRCKGAGILTRQQIDLKS